MRKKIEKIFFNFFAFFFYLSSITGQQTVSLEIMTLGIHPFSNPNLKFYENKIDSLGYINYEPGLKIGYEFYIKGNFLSIKISQAIFSDAGAKKAGFTSITLRYMLFHKFRNLIYLEGGPSLFYRETWKSFGPQYMPETNYKENGDIEYKPFFITKFDYSVFIGKRLDFTLSLMYGHYYKTFSILGGIRFWINPYVKIPIEECDCPTFSNKKNPFRRIKTFLKNLYRQWKSRK